MQQLLSTADLLQITDVRESFCDFLQAQLDPTNCLSINAFADQHSCADLAAATDVYVTEHFTEVTKEEEISFDPTQLPRFLANDRLANTNQG